MIKYYSGKNRTEDEEDWDFWDKDYNLKWGGQDVIDRDSDI